MTADADVEASAAVDAGVEAAADVEAAAVLWLLKYRA